MTPKKMHLRTKNTFNQSTSNKMSQSKYPYSQKKFSLPKKSHKKPNNNVFWILTVIIVLLLASFVGLRLRSLYSMNVICKGISIDGIDLSDMSYTSAYKKLANNSQTILDSISINLHYQDKSWHFDARQLDASIDVDSVLKQAQKLGHQGTLADRIDSQKELSKKGISLKTSIKIDKQVLIDALNLLQKEIDNPMVETTIAFDPSDYDFFDDHNNPTTSLARDMFTITEGKTGYVMDYQDTRSQLEAALENGYTADIDVKVIKVYPTYTVDELEKCTTLLFHSSSKISTDNSKNDNRNHNILKALSYYKGLVVMPGEIVSYNDLLGERTERAGWLKAPTITPQKTLKDELGGGICQVSTTVFNAAFRAGAKILDLAPHSWPAYHNDFGYGMDSMVNYGTSDFIFQNATAYPMFFDAYVWVSPSSGKPRYVDVDVYSMPQEGNTHIRPECIIEERQPPPEPEYIEDTENKYEAEEWKVDTTLNLMTYTHRKPRDLVKVRVSKVWYENCVETDPGIWDGGDEVKREESHYSIYDSVQAIIYTKPLPDSENTTG